MIGVTIFLPLPTSVYWLAVAFGACGIIFLYLAVTQPVTTISIDDTKITRSGRFFGDTLRFNEIASARVERDLDAQNFRQVIIRSHRGGNLLIDPRFLNPDIDGLIDLLQQRLQEHGIELVTDRTEARKD